MSIRIPPLPLSRSLVQFGAAPVQGGETEVHEDGGAKSKAGPYSAARPQITVAPGPSAEFLTHLIAVRLNAEHLRARRRASADYAMSAYNAAPFASLQTTYRAVA